MERSGPTPCIVTLSFPQGQLASGSGTGGRTQQLLNVCRLDDSLLPDRVWRAGKGGAENKGTGAATRTPSLRTYSDLTCTQPMDLDYLACDAWLTLWPSWCDTGGQPSLASLRCHADKLPCLLLSAGFMALQTSLQGLVTLVCLASPLAQLSHQYTHLPTQSFTHCPLDVRPSYAWSLVLTLSKTVDQYPRPLMGWGREAPLQCELNLLSHPCEAGGVN